MLISSTQPAQAYAVGDRVQISSEAQSPTYVITAAELNQPERVWNYGVQKEGREEVKWVAEGELK